VPRRVARRPAWLLVGCAFSIALHSLSRNRTRAFLSTLGIIVGIGCVITMMALAEGTRVRMLEEVRKTGSALLTVRPAEQRVGAVRLGADVGRRSLTLEDVDAIARRCDAVVRASPRVSDPAQVEWGNGNTRTEVMGVTAEYLPIRNFRVAHGRSFSPEESDSRSRVCLLGVLTAEQLFGKRSPLGKRVKVQGQRFRVIGVMAPRDGDWDDRVWVPVRTAMDRLFSQDHVERIEVQARDEASLTLAARQIETLLRRRHGIRVNGENDFEIRNQQERLEAAQQTAQILAYLLVGIASISLLVGGIGVMNIMLVSVTERTREIGIRRAIGARRQDILWQFLIEALVMCALGALLGLFAGFGACHIGAVYAGWSTLITPGAVVLSTGFAVGIGLVFGLYPAVRASRLLPVTALRHD
jgi:putative ABC transport system permease protein